MIWFILFIGLTTHYLVGFAFGYYVGKNNVLQHSAGTDMNSHIHKEKQNG